MSHKYFSDDDLLAYIHGTLPGPITVALELQLTTDEDLRERVARHRAIMMALARETEAEARVHIRAALDGLNLGEEE